MATKVGVFHGRGDAGEWMQGKAPKHPPPPRPPGMGAPTPPYYYTLSATPQGRTGVKLNRVFLPRRFCYARSRSSGFTRTWVGTVGTSLIHSCTSLIR